METVRLGKHESSYLSKAELAHVINAGLERLDGDEAVDYVLVTDADIVFPEDHVDAVTGRMMRDGAVLAAGVVDGEGTRYIGDSIRFCDWRWWKENYNHGRYPAFPEFTSVQVIRALMSGATVMVYRDLKVTTRRPTGRSYTPEIDVWRGASMRALGYPWIHALLTCGLQSRTIGIGRAMARLGGYRHGRARRDPDLRRWARRRSYKHLFTFGFLRGDPYG